MPLFETLLNALLYTIAAFLLLNCLYLLFFAIAGHVGGQTVKAQTPVLTNRKFCVLIPAYKEDEVILETTKAALRHAYDGEFDVFVIADSLKPQTISGLQRQGAGVLEVNFERSTKGKALLHALRMMPPKAYDAALVLDADNIMGEHLLRDVNLAMETGYKVVQAHRTAKNRNTAFAYLDACNEEINNHIYRKGHFAVGLSSALIGSGMAFEFSYLKKLLTDIGETVGEDKELDFRIARDRETICYLQDAYVYDEKVENAKVFTQQRTRWISAQLEFMKKYALEGLVQLFRYNNIGFFDKVVQAFLVPRMLLIGVLGVFFLLALVLPVGPSPLAWFLMLALLAGTLFISLPARLYRKELFGAMSRLPYALWCMFKALFSIHKTKASFLPTPHKASGMSSSV